MRRGEGEDVAPSDGVGTSVLSESTSGATAHFREPVVALARRALRDPGRVGWQAGREGLVDLLREWRVPHSPASTVVEIPVQVPYTRSFGGRDVLQVKGLGVVRTLKVFGEVLVDRGKLRAKIALSLNGASRPRCVCVCVCVCAHPNPPLGGGAALSGGCMLCGGGGGGCASPFRCACALHQPTRSLCLSTLIVLTVVIVIFFLLSSQSSSSHDSPSLSA